MRPIVMMPEDEIIIVATRAKKVNPYAKNGDRVMGGNILDVTMTPGVAHTGYIKIRIWGGDGHSEEDQISIVTFKFDDILCLEDCGV